MLTSLLFSSLKATSVIWMCTKTTSFEIVTLNKYFSSGQFGCSVVSNSLWPHESQHARPPCPSPSPRVHSRLTSIESVMPSSHLILGRPLLLLPPLHRSIRVFSTESTVHMSYGSFSFSIIPPKEIPRLISFRMDWLDLLAVKGLSRVYSNTTVQKHLFFRAHPSSQPNSHIHTWPLEKP